MKTAIEIMYWILGSLMITMGFIVLVIVTLIADFIYKRGLKDGEQDDE